VGTCCIVIKGESISESMGTRTAEGRCLFGQQNEGEKKKEKKKLQKKIMAPKKSEKIKNLKPKCLVSKFNGRVISFNFVIFIFIFFNSKHFLNIDNIYFFISV